MVTLPFEARNEVLLIFVGFADHPVSNVPRSQPLIFFLPAKAMQNKFRKFEELVLWFPVSGFWFPIPDSGSAFWFPVSGF